MEGPPCKNIRIMKNSLAVAICSVLAVICIGCAISTAFVKSEFISIDLMAALVGVLSLLVTVLAVFLAINYILLERRILDNVNKKIGQIKSDVDNQVHDMNCAVKAYFTYADSGEFIVSSLHGRLVGCLKSLKIESESQNRYALDVIIKEFVNLIPSLDENESYLPLGTKKDYLSMLRKIDHPQIDDIYSFVSSLPEQEENG